MNVRATQRGRRILTWAICLFALDFFSFVLSSAALGGDALSGGIENGIFFLSNHGHKTEVTESLYYFSLVHGISAFVMFVAVGVVAVALFATEDLFNAKENERR